jgi:hypothetical protein
LKVSIFDNGPGLRFECGLQMENLKGREPCYDEPECAGSMIRPAGSGELGGGGTAMLGRCVDRCGEREGELFRLKMEMEFSVELPGLPANRS